MRSGTQEMLGLLEVKGEATEASSSDREMPACARFRAYGGEGHHAPGQGRAGQGKAQLGSLSSKPPVRHTHTCKITIKLQ